ncbi:unnamed protein product, partial [Mesorhabditis belari]|uniref:C2H2-type domain-containing protein n=1 Tax=Mesorhabditis belari TaxID=2138241 RepID=A0AAF3EFB2_9BILA
MDVNFDDTHFYDSILEDFEDDALPSKSRQGEEETHEASKRLEEIVRQEEEGHQDDPYLPSNRRRINLNRNVTYFQNTQIQQSFSRTPSQQYFYVEPPVVDERRKEITTSSIQKADAETGPKSLNRLSLKIGSKVFRYKVVNIADMPSTSSDYQVDGQDSFAWESMNQVEVQPVAQLVPPVRLRLNRSVKQSYCCSECSATFLTKGQLMRHLSSHSFHKPFRCCYHNCAKAFTTIDGLRLHEKLHLEGKQYECELCHKTFSRQHNLIMHLRLHQSGRRHFCSFCGKWFRLFVSMYEHQNLCSSRLPGEVPPSEKPLRYKCTYCEKMFHHKRDKQIHERVHTGERPYSCGYCGRGFSQSQALTVHIRLHTGEKPYQCKTCELSFRDTSALRKHEFNHHCGIR